MQHDAAGQNVTKVGTLKPGPKPHVWTSRKEERAYLAWQAWSGACVRVAVYCGLIAPARNMRCTDCAKPAHEYDHRDYGKPFDIDPVCKGCNRKRGKAIFPLGNMPPAVWRMPGARRGMKKPPRVKRAIHRKTHIWPPDIFAERAA